MTNNIYNIVNQISHIALEHQLVKQVTYGDVYEEINTQKQNLYAACHIMIDTVNVDVNNDTQTINGTMFYIDRLMDDNKNKLEIQAEGQRTLEEILIKLQETYSWIFSQQQYTLFTEKFSDLCAGCYVTFSVEVPVQMICSDDSFVGKTLNITENGTYDVSGYDKVTININ